MLGLGGGGGSVSGCEGRGNERGVRIINHHLFLFITLLHKPLTQKILFLFIHHNFFQLLTKMDIEFEDSSSSSNKITANEEVNVVSPGDSSDSTSTEEVEVKEEKYDDRVKKALFGQEDIDSVDSQISGMIVDRQRFAYTVHNGYLYVFGGSSLKNERLNKAERYCLKTRKWTKLPDMNHRRVFCSCAAIDDKIYIIGGMIDDDRTATDIVDVLNINTNKWSRLPERTLVKREKHCSVAIGTKIYVFGGYRIRDSSESYDTKTGLWTRLPRMTVPRYSFTSLVHHKTIYAIGGMINLPCGQASTVPQYHRYLATMDIFDSDTEQWTTSSSTMMNRRAGSSAILIGSTIQLIGGYDEKGCIRSIESFDISTENGWTGSQIELTVPARKDFAAITLDDDYLIMCGGTSDPNLTLNSVETVKLPTSLVSSSIPSINKSSNIDPDKTAAQDNLIEAVCTSFSQVIRGKKPASKATTASSRTSPRQVKDTMTKVTKTKTNGKDDIKRRHPTIKSSNVQKRQKKQITEKKVLSSSFLEDERLSKILSAVNKQDASVNQAMKERNIKNKKHMSLKERRDKLQLHILEECEMEVFGGIQNGKYNSRVKKLEEFFPSKH